MSPRALELLFQSKHPSLERTKIIYIACSCEEDPGRVFRADVVFDFWLVDDLRGDE